MRCLLDALTVSRSTTASMVCFSCFFSFGGSVSGCTTPSTRTRAKPLICRSANRSTYSPLRSRIDRREDLEPGALRHLQDAVDDLLRGLLGDRLAADRAVRLADAGVEQAQVVVDLGDRADRRARVPRGRLLVDRHRRRQALDEVDVRLVHLAEELPRVGRQRLDVAALALGEDRVEGQARLARAGQPGEHDHRVAGQVEVDVLEVVLAGATDDQPVSHGLLSVRQAHGSDARHKRAY